MQRGRARAVQRARARQRRLLRTALACFAACLVLAGAARMLPALPAGPLPTSTVQSPADHTSETDTLSRLRAMAAQDSRIDTILQSPSDYPQALLEMLARDISLLEFALGFPEKQGNVYADSIGLSLIHI